VATLEEIFADHPSTSSDAAVKSDAPQRPKQLASVFGAFSGNELSEQPDLPQPGFDVEAALHPVESLVAANDDVTSPTNSADSVMKGRADRSHASGTPEIQSLADAAFLRDRKLQQDAIKASQIAQTNGGVVSTLFAQLRAGSAAKPDATMLERMRIGRSVRAMEALGGAARTLNVEVTAYVRGSAEQRIARLTKLSDAMDAARRALRDAKSVVTEKSPSTVLEQYQRDTLQVSRCLSAIDGTGNPARDTEFDQLMLKTKFTMKQATAHVEQLFASLSQLISLRK
jgi:hypothetical protein